MPETNFKNTASSIIPDDPEQSAYRFIIVAAKRRCHGNGSLQLSAHHFEETVL